MGTASSKIKSGSNGGTASSSGGANVSGAAAVTSHQSVQKRDAHVRKKLESAEKTGVLNLSDLNMKLNLPLWGELASPVIVARLKTLDLSGNRLKAIPVEVYQLVNLKSLFLTGCNLQFTNNLHDMVNLTKLKLDHNDLEVEKVRTLPISLVILDLSFNHLVGIPASLNGLINLLVLNLSNNRIESIYGIDGLLALTHLNLDDNLLVELPESICQLVKLKKLSLARNRFTKHSISRPGDQSIPAALLERSELDHIDLAGNVGLSKAEVMAFAGIEHFLRRRQALSDKNFQGGALADNSLFGLD